jgi:hypothetical protein
MASWRPPEQRLRPSSTIRHAREQTLQSRRASLDNLEGAELTEPVDAYGRRARTAFSDAALGIGATNDFVEAPARRNGTG